MHQLNHIHPRKKLLSYLSAIALMYTCIYIYKQYLMTFFFKNKSGHFPKFVREFYLKNISRLIKSQIYNSEVIC